MAACWPERYSVRASLNDEPMAGHGAACSVWPSFVPRGPWAEHETTGTSPREHLDYESTIARRNHRYGERLPRN